jgi:hypothetical protein
MSNPNLACIGGKCLLIDATDDAGSVVGCWCLWCGTATYDGERISDEGQPIGFVPSFTVRLPDGFHRRREDAA